MTRPAPRGYTLLEMVLVVLIIAILGNYANYTVQLISGTKVQRAWADARLLAQALYGPESRNENGFVAEIGRFPADFTNELAFAGSGQFAGKSNFHGVMYGWGGPYALPGADQTSLVRDPWGRPWVLRDTADGRICSLGANGVDENGGGDDICSPNAPPMVNGAVGTIVVWVTEENGVPMDDAFLSVNIYGASPLTTPPGQLRAFPLGFPRVGGVPRGYFARNDVVIGRHVVEVVGRTGTPYEGVRGYALPWVGAGDVSVVTIRLRP